MNNKKQTLYIGYRVKKAENLSKSDLRTVEAEEFNIIPKNINSSEYYYIFFYTKGKNYIIPQLINKKLYNTSENDIKNINYFLKDLRNTIDIKELLILAKELLILERKTSFKLKKEKIDLNKIPLKYGY